MAIKINVEQLRKAIKENISWLSYSHDNGEDSVYYNLDEDDCNDVIDDIMTDIRRFAE